MKHAPERRIGFRETQFKLGAPRPGTSVRDYEAVDNRNRHIAGPFKHYSDAKNAAGPGGHVKYVRPGAQAEARRSPRGGSTKRISNRAPQMTPEAVMEIAHNLCHKVGGTGVKHIGAHRWGDRNESAVFRTYSPEHQQPVIVLVSVFEDGTVALDFFSDEYLSETQRYENIVHFLYSTVDLGEMAADLKWVWETVDGYAESWQEDQPDVDEAPTPKVKAKAKRSKPKKKSARRKRR